MSASFPDVANFGAAPAAIGLARVGMSAIEVPVRLELPVTGQLLLMARADAYVSLDRPDIKGIHMSRLFLKLNEHIAAKVLTAKVVSECLGDFLASHHGLSKDAYLSLKFELPLERKALVSEHSGWRAYPVSIIGELVEGRTRLQLDVQLTYSSTCPCSAALARQLVQKRFLEVFASKPELSVDEVADWLTREDAILATPHGQRSHADVSVVATPDSGIPDIVALIDAIEVALGTPVQAAVKRSDEQEFARLNGGNLMFAEDAARKAATALSDFPNLDDFRVKVSHYESLHPHDAIAVAVKGVDGGFKA